MNNYKETNPFIILDVDKKADKRQILKQVTFALSQHRYNAKMIAESQKTLFNPLKRVIAEFQYFIKLSSPDTKITENLEKTYPIPELLNIHNEAETKK